MKAPHRRDGTQDEPGMTSMIDVVFLLLIFFVWTSSFDKPERDIASRIAMPESQIKSTESEGSAKTPKSPIRDRESRAEDVVVRIIAEDAGDPQDARVSYLIGAVKVSTIDDLLPKLTKIAALPTSTILIVDPDDGVEFAECVDVYDHAIGAGFSRVLFAVD